MEHQSREQSGNRYQRRIKEASSGRQGPSAQYVYLRCGVPSKRVASVRNYILEELGSALQFGSQLPAPGMQGDHADRKGESWDPKPVLGRDEAEKAEATPKWRGLGTPNLGKGWLSMDQNVMVWSKRALAHRSARNPQSTKRKYSSEEIQMTQG